MTTEEMKQGIHDLAKFAGVHGWIGEPDERIIATLDALTERYELKARLAEYVRRARELMGPRYLRSTSSTIRDNQLFELVRDLAAEKVEP